MKKLVLFPNGQNVNEIKNQAKRLHKSKAFPSRSAALNSISQDICGLSFNKAVHKFTDLAILAFDDENCMIPFEFEGQNYYVQIFTPHDTLYFKETQSMSLPSDVHFPEFEYKNFEKTEDGYRINLVDERESKYFLELTQNEEGISSNLYYCEEVQEGIFEPININGDFIAYSELMEVYDDAKTIDFGDNEEASDFDLSIQFNHQKVDEKTKLFTIHNKYEFSVIGCTTVITPDGEYLTGHEILVLIHEKVCSKNELLRFLEQNEDIKSLNGYTVASNPYISIEDLDDDGSNDEVTDHIKKNLYLNLEY